MPALESTGGGAGGTLYREGVPCIFYFSSSLFALDKIHGLAHIVSFH